MASARSPRRPLSARMALAEMLVAETVIQPWLGPWKQNGGGGCNSSTVWCPEMAPSCHGSFTPSVGEGGWQLPHQGGSNVRPANWLQPPETISLLPRHVIGLSLWDNWAGAYIETTNKICMFSPMSVAADEFLCENKNAYFWPSSA